MKTHNNIEIMNERMSKKQIAKTKRMGFRLDTSDNTWGKYEKDELKRRKIFYWCLHGKRTCWICTSSHKHIMETKDGVNTTRLKEFKEKKRWKQPKVIIYKHGCFR